MVWMKGCGTHNGKSCSKNGVFTETGMTTGLPNFLPSINHSEIRVVIRLQMGFVKVRMVLHNTFFVHPAISVWRKPLDGQESLR